MERIIDGGIMGWELGWMGWLGTEVEKASNPTLGAEFGEVRPITGNVKKTRILILTDTKTLLPRNIHDLMPSLLPLKPALLVLPVLSAYEFREESCCSRGFTQRCLPIFDGGSDTIINPACG